MFRRAIFSSLVVIAAGFSGCTYHMQCGTGGCAAMAGADACAGCGDVACAGRCGMGRGFGPLGFARYMGTCGAGCGGMYFNEWIADPPDACDPCDDCGNFIGRQCCMPRFRRWAVAARSMWGFRYDGRCGSCGGNCGGGCAHAGDLIEDGGTIYHGPSHSSNGTNGGSGEQVAPPPPVPTPEPEAYLPPETRSIKKPWRQSSAADYYPRGEAR